MRPSKNSRMLDSPYFRCRRYSGFSVVSPTTTFRCKPHWASFATVDAASISLSRTVTTRSSDPWRIWLHPWWSCLQQRIRENEIQMRCMSTSVPSLRWSSLTTSESIEKDHPVNNHIIRQSMVHYHPIPLQTIKKWICRMISHSKRASLSLQQQVAERTALSVNTISATSSTSQGRVENPYRRASKGRTVEREPENA